MISVRVRFFGECRELAGTHTGEVSLLDGALVKTALAAVIQQYPGLRKLEDRLLVAVNEVYATPGTSLSDNDTLAIFPPVSGGQEDVCQLTQGRIDTRRLVGQLAQSQDGAIVAFEGIVRNHSMGQAVLYLEYEAYEPMALKMMHQISREVHYRWSVDRIGMIHRLGRLEIGETSVAIVVTSEHRRQAFEACHYAIDRLKKIVPIWKREYFEDGVVWVEGEGCSQEELPLT